MGRILAIDYGSKRTGIAVTDPLQIVANGLTTVSTHDLLPFLKQYIQKEQVDCIVVGQPRRWSGEKADIEMEIVKMVEQLKKQFADKKIERVDERFTSKLAFQAMIDGGLKKKARAKKETIDKVSATLILQNYLEQK